MYIKKVVSGKSNVSGRIIRRHVFCGKALLYVIDLLRSAMAMADDTQETLVFSA